MELVGGGRGLWGEGRGMGGEVLEGDLNRECAIVHELKVVGQVGGRARDLIYPSNRLYGHDGHTLMPWMGPDCPIHHLSRWLEEAWNGTGTAPVVQTRPVREVQVWHAPLHWHSHYSQTFPGHTNISLRLLCPTLIHVHGLNAKGTKIVGNHVGAPDE